MKEKDEHNLVIRVTNYSSDGSSAEEGIASGILILGKLLEAGSKQKSKFLIIKISGQLLKKWKWPLIKRKKTLMPIPQPSS